MDENLIKQIFQLKLALMSLSPTGENGFEGLIGLTLNNITGISFRLAGSGSQFGIDGKGSDVNDSICFEAKRYDKSPSRESLLSKITDLAINDHGVDIWVLGCTAAIKTQIVDDVRKVGNKDGIYVLVLDWAENHLPDLAIALSMGGKAIESFIQKNIQDPKLFTNAKLALHSIKLHNHFLIQSEKLKQRCNSASIGYGIAKQVNTKWLLDKLSNKQKAKSQFGQPICPSDPSILNIKQRTDLITQLTPYFEDTSDSNVVFVNGGEGNGKSWIIAQSWLSLKYKPIMVFMNPEDFPKSALSVNITDIIIEKIILQTGDVNSPVIKKRWERIFASWKNHFNEDKKQVIVVIDGINQKPNTDWARIIDATNLELNQLGGRLFVSSRTPYFNSIIKKRIESNYKEILIPEWTKEERDEILLEKEIKGENLKANVANSLCNPRLLGIALDLLTMENIANIDELSVSRLLLEHIESTEKNANKQQSSAEFLKRLRDDACKILTRIKTGIEDDLKVFEGELTLVADGLFYELLEDDSTRYRLKDDGITLALSLSVIDQLKKALRNGRNLDDTLNKVIDPIAALDNTADVILSAITASVLDDQCNEKIVIVLIKGFSSLQNTNNDDFSVFCGLAKKKILGFLKASRELCLLGGHQPNFDWVEEAVLTVKHDERIWNQMESEVLSWLSFYSLSPKLSAFKNTEEELQEITTRITTSLENLSIIESDFLGHMIELNDGDLVRLSQLALTLLAGKPLAKYTKPLAKWKFTQLLNSSHYSPHQYFIDLIRLNTLDWLETRNGLIHYCDKLRNKEVSRVGKWTLVNILRSTGDKNDGLEDEMLVKELTKDNESRSWRLIENYCSVDPCDPFTVEPSNITKTKESYKNIDVTKLALTAWSTADYQFLESASYGMVRFAPDIAINKHRELINDIITRNETELRQGLYALLRHSSLINISQAESFISKWNCLKLGIEPLKLSDTDLWVPPQYILLLIFPILDASEQASVFLSNEMDENVLLNLLGLLKPLKEKELAGYLKVAFEENNEHKMLLSTLYAHYTLKLVSSDIRATILKGLSSEFKKVRQESLGVAIETEDRELIKAIAESDFNANKIPDGKSNEAWYGSLAIIQAVRNGFISSDEAINRITPATYGKAATIFDSPTINKIAGLIDKSLLRVTNLDIEPYQIDMELSIDNLKSNEPNMFKLNNLTPESNDPMERMKSIADEGSFKRKQEQAHDAFSKFRTDLTRENALIILDNLPHLELEVIINTVPIFKEKWYSIFENMNEIKVPAMYNFILKFAFAFRISSPTKTLILLNKIKGSSPWIHLISGKAKIGFDSIVIWSCENNAFKELQFQRLDDAKTDKDLALEVVAALLNKRHEALTLYINEKLNKQEPSEVARGIMVAGFSDKSKFNSNILKTYSKSKGLAGAAYKAANYAYQRNEWSRHWYDLMHSTNNVEEFWCYSQLFLKIVDHRFDVWNGEYNSGKHPMTTYSSSYKDKIGQRFERWNKHREKTLFGEKAPNPMFLSSCKV
jgi:hypothetical protein